LCEVNDKAKSSDESGWEPIKTYQIKCCENDCFQHYFAIISNAMAASQNSLLLLF